jgi:Flp pilus assembly pilin Flp
VGVTRGVARFIVDDRGQDLLEYALLSGIIGMIGLAVYPVIVDKMTDAYADWVSEVNNLWEPCPPAPAACP